MVGTVTLDQHARDLLQEREWLTVREFATRYKMEEKSVYEAIRKGRLAFEVVRLTEGRHARSIRIGPPKKAA